jgi:hypothetical protein
MKVGLLAVPVCLLAAAACSSSEDEAQPTTTASLVASPACGKGGDRIALRLVPADSGTPPRCVSTQEFAVRFTGAALAPPDQAGISSAGYCQLEMSVPAGAQTGKISVTTAGQTYETKDPFAIPCP